MKIVVIGGTGLIGSKLVDRLRGLEHEVLAASPNSGVNTITGEGLAEVLTGAQVVVDVANSPSFEDAAVLKFFATSTRNLLAAEAKAGVKHHVALSVVGTDRLQESGYFRAKLAQENLIKASAVPYSILRSTQFFEFVGRIAQAGADGKSVRASDAMIQPILSDDVVAALADITVGSPLNGIAEVAGPDRFRLDALLRHSQAASGDPREVITDPAAGYFGAKVNDQTLTPGAGARIGATHFEDWLKYSALQSSAQKASAPATTSAARH